MTCIKDKKYIEVDSPDLYTYLGRGSAIEACWIKTMYVIMSD